ncbi:YhcH/YjgK/YiaL family protein [Clostridium algidicarnis]|uniref:YhcH/YjgK/YiaL family protein n=1 Tax=Clostridium algidicarnis TaxID=37659 RepID=UPI003FD73E08
MIMDLIENAELYYGISPEIKEALNFLKKEDIRNIPVGRYDILEDKVFALVQEYEPSDISEYELESHKRYIDLQFIVRGKESIAYANIKDLHISKEYDEESDYQLLKGPSDILTAKENSFFIFMPEDAHKPGIRLEDCLNVKKIVVKVLISSDS